METVYDLVILGAGSVGLTVGLYRGRYRLNTLLVERGQNDGQIVIIPDIENYPGQTVEAEESGIVLIARMTKQVDKFGIHQVSVPIEEVELEDPMERLTGTKGNVYEGETVIIATGVHPRPTRCEDEEEFLDRGIFFCITCDTNPYKGMEVYVTGGGDSAVEEATYLTKPARRVTMIHRRDQLRAVQSIQEKVFRNEKLHFMWDNVVDEVRGDGILDAMIMRNIRTGESTQVNADLDDGVFGLFGFIGYLPNTGLLEGTGLTTEGGYIRTNEGMHTNLSGIYAADDVRVRSLHRVVMATADETIAACQAEHYAADLQ